MIIFPAIDLRRGCCVRLRQGDPEQETVYSEDPARMAVEWENSGGTYLHVVDLDGAFSGKTANARAVANIAREISVPFQLGGGIRSRQAVEDALALGVSRVIVGTMAVENPQLLKEIVNEYDERIVVGVDARDGMVAVRGWSDKSDLPVVELVKRLEDAGVKEVIYTDIARDGMLEGPNYKATEKLASSTSLSVIASGGVSGVNDLIKLKELAPLGVRGVIVGKALYSGRLTLPEAIAAVK